MRDGRDRVFLKTTLFRAGSTWIDPASASDLIELKSVGLAIF